jgi:acetolactate synthase small subunit
MLPMPPVCAPDADVNQPITAYFSVWARAEPGVMPRVLELFAKRGLVPTVWRSALADGERGQLTIDIEMGGLGREVASYIASCLRQIADVEMVRAAAGEAIRADRQSG